MKGAKSEGQHIAKMVRGGEPSSRKRIRVVELFAGVGGFRLGLEAANKDLFKTVWFNQWEPGSKVQIAYEIYRHRWPGGNDPSNKDIALVQPEAIPSHDLLVGGFPCQDYSVAKTLNQAQGIRGKKGVLWWEIHRIIADSLRKPKYLFLENVDRLLKSPAEQRGRDFAIMLASLSDLDYAIEWRVINAADYGYPQRRRRVYILGYHKGTDLYKSAVKKAGQKSWLLEDGVFSKAFPVGTVDLPFVTEFPLNGTLDKLTEDFNLRSPGLSPFGNAGVMFSRKVFTLNVSPAYEGKCLVLGDIIQSNGSVSEEYYLDKSSIDKWQYLKGAKKAKRVSRKTGHEYSYNEGGMSFPDPLDRPSRTIVTGEGGATPSRFKHVITMPDGRLRRLTPFELEKLNGFPGDHTASATPIQRAFLMGNALVVDVVKEVGKELARRIK